ncbi:hypothetical protein ZWY2020_004021 [Hordeum vulgare]|nr:hypothetical protein ZWY2020_004021 [Hordeum vulgare]
MVRRRPHRPAILELALFAAVRAATPHLRHCDHASEPACACLAALVLTPGRPRLCLESPPPPVRIWLSGRRGPGSASPHPEQLRLVNTRTSHLCLRIPIVAPRSEPILTFRRAYEPAAIVASPTTTTGKQ